MEMTLFEEFAKTHESELIEVTSSFAELLTILKFVDLITSQEFDEIKILSTEKAQIQKCYRFLARSGNEKIELLLTVLKKTSNFEVYKQLEKFVKENAQRKTIQDGINNWNPRRTRTQMDRRFHYSPQSKTKNNKEKELPLTVKVKTETSRKKPNDPSSSYDLRSQPRGFALIVNNIYFKNGLNNGVKMESLYIFQLFHGLGFSCTLLEDVQGHEFNQVINSFKKKFTSRESKVDCCAIVILSNDTNTNNGGITMSDGGNVDIIRDLILQFGEENCPELKGKAKLFFMQTCPNYEYFKNDETLLTLSPHVKDTFLALCNSPESETNQNQSNGFVYHLTNIMTVNSSSMDLIAMMNKVSDAMKTTPNNKSEVSKNKLILQFHSFDFKPFLWFNPED